MNRSLSLFLPAIALVAPLAYAATAHAGLAACGDIHVEAEAQCEVKGGIQCEAECTPVSFQAQCAAELSVDCDGECNLSASVECSGSCNADCMAECEANPGNYECEGSCFADCSGSCEGNCSAGSEGAQCRASCEATCDGECGVQCEGTPPSATCEAKCEASCEGSCRGEANASCQIDCQASGFAECEARLEGGCKIDCDAEQGALFCDGQYVDHGGNLEECVAALKAAFDIEVEGYAEGECSNGKCQGEAGGSITCAVDPEHGRNAWLGAFGLVVLVAAATRRRA